MNNNKDYFHVNRVTSFITEDGRRGDKVVHSPQAKRKLTVDVKVLENAYISVMLSKSEISR